MAELERSPKRRKITDESDHPFAAIDSNVDEAATEIKVSDPKLAGSNGIGAINEDNRPRGQSHDTHAEVQDVTIDATANDPLQAIDAEPNGTANPPLSKSQQKKLKRKEMWEAGREDRKAWKKEKLKEKKARKRADRIQEADEVPVTAIEKPDTVVTSKKKEDRRNRHLPIQLPITFVFDCGFDDLMLDKEIVSLASQLTRSYSDNCKAKYRNHMAISSFGGKLRERFDTVLSKHHENWKGVRFYDEDFVSVAEQWQAPMREKQGGKLAGAFSEISPSAAQNPLDEADEGNKDFENAEIIYLTSDSPNTLTELKPYSTYVIGGLVDRNRHKGICYKRACDRDMKTARLPIGLYMEMASRFVLATNHVAEIMLRWLEYRDWGKAFMDVMPKRKGGVLKEKAEDVGEEQGGGFPEVEEMEVADEDEDGEGRLEVDGEEDVATQDAKGIGVEEANTVLEEDVL